MIWIYISGPMTGYANLNRDAFENAGIILAARGYVPVSPADIVPPSKTPEWSDYLRADLAVLVLCEGVAVLPGWEASRGAQLEVHVAHALGMNVLPIHLWGEKS